MDLFKNPFYILGTTPRDDKYRIIELADEKSLLSDADECMEAKDILIAPRRRVSAEVAWLPGVDPSFYGLLFRYLESPNEELPNITMAPIASANLRTTKLSRYANLLSSDILEWTLEITQKSEAIQPEEVREVLNNDRSVARFPETAELDVDDAIRSQKRYYSETVTSVLENLPVNDQARIMTSLLETSTSNGRYQCPTLIRDLMPAYELSVQDSLEQYKRIIEAQDEQLRAMADARNPDTTLSQIVDQILESLKEWDTLAQPIQLSQRSTGQRHDASFEMAGRFSDLAAALFFQYCRPDLSRKILNTLRDVFSEVSEIVEQIVEILRELETQVGIVIAVENFENIKAQVEQLTAASDARQPDYTLTPMVNQLIQSVESWDTTQHIDANSGVAFTVREGALHLWNKHKKLDFSKKILITLKSVFAEVPDIARKITTDLEELISIEKFEEIKTQVEELQNTSDARQPDYTLTPMVNQLIQTVRSWNPSTQPVEANNAVANTVRNIAIHLWNAHQKLYFATKIIFALIEVFRGMDGMDEVNNRLNEDIITLGEMATPIEQPQPRGGTGCLLQIVIFVVIGVIVALSQGC